jgi:hypothetical protein
MKAKQLVEQQWFNYDFYLQEMLFLSHCWLPVRYWLQKGRQVFVFNFVNNHCKNGKEKREYWTQIKKCRKPNQLPWKLYVWTLYPQMIHEYGAMMEWYWQEKTKELGGKPVSMLFCPPQIPHGLPLAWTQASAVRGKRLTTRAMALPLQNDWLQMWSLVLTVAPIVCSQGQCESIYCNLNSTSDLVLNMLLDIIHWLC